MSGAAQQVRVDLAYGRHGLPITLPADRTSVVAPAHHPAAADEAAALRDALRSPVAGPPLRSVVRPGQRIAVSICDVTRPQPREAMVLLTQARVGVHCATLPDQDLRSAHCFGVPDVALAVQEELATAGPDARVCVLPEGPQTIPFLANPEPGHHE